MLPNNKFPKSEKLCGFKAVEALFAQGKSVKSFPLKLIFLPQPQGQAHLRILISVPKKQFKKAIARNRMKRLLREAYRLEKQAFYGEKQPYALGIIYLWRKEMPLAELRTQIREIAQQWHAFLQENPQGDSNLTQKNT